MLTRRNFLKGLLSTVAAGALVKNGILRPEQVIAEPERRVFDMAANTWRNEYVTTLATALDGRIGPSAVWDRALSMPEIIQLAPNYGSTISMSVSRLVGVNGSKIRVGDQVCATFTLDSEPIILGRAVRVSEEEGWCHVNLQSPGQYQRPSSA